MSRTYIQSMVSRIRFFLLAFAACLAGGLPTVQAAFDPVNDDTDIFLTNPEIEAQRPNVLILVDSSANWAQAFDNEKAALVTVIQNLSDGFNVGMMLMAETGGGNNTTDGMYPRFAVRRMTTANKETFANDIIDPFDKTADASNNAIPGLGMLEAYRYFAGKSSYAGHGKKKTDFANNTIYKACNTCPVTSHPATADSLGDYAMNSTAAGLYNSPIVEGCQSNFIIYISNGPPLENASAQTVSENELDSLGYDTSSNIAITPDGLDGNWMDEWADYMANADVNEDLDGDQHVYTYTVEIDSFDTGQGDDASALFESAALKGKGQYFDISSGNGGQAIVNALNSIFQEIQAVNSVFASTTLPVSVNVRGTNLNQVYIGVFRPDEVKQPRWYGNLKMYNLGFDDATNTLFLADAAGQRAENPETGFINPTSPSFWTEDLPSGFWSFRTPDQNGAGSINDYPDGDLVEKGGAAAWQRTEFDLDQTTRDVYTCTTGTVDCVAGSSLSATPFTEANDGITAGGLNLGVAAVSSLTGFATQTITALTDTKEVSGLSTAAGGVTVSDLDNGTVSKTITALTTTQTLGITALTNSSSQAITSLTHPPSGGSQGVVTATVSSGHGFGSSGTIAVTISGATAADYNGSFTATILNSTQFTYTTSGGSSVGNDPTPASVPGNVITTSTVVTAQINGHPFESGQSITIAGVTPTTYNTTYASMSKLSANTFSFVTAAPLAPITSIVGATATGQTKTANATVASHGYLVGDNVTVSGVNLDDYEGAVEITAKDTNTFSYTVPNRLANGAGAPTMTVSKGSTTVTATAAGHAFNDGDTVTISGATPADYNGSYVIFGVVAGTSFQYTTPTALTAESGTIFAASGTSNIATASVANHQFGTSGTVSVKIEGVSNLPAAYNGTVTATILDADTFTYPTEDGTSALPATGTITARLATSTAFATVPAHGYATAGNTFTITTKGATPTGYNRNDVTATAIDDDTFKYPILTVVAQGAATGTLTANQKTTTATVRAVAHGFPDASAVDMDGATPDDFNGNFTIDVVDADNFTYSLLENDGSTPAQGDAAGTITASAGVGSGEREELISWMRGADNVEDEDTDTLTTDARASIHGDVLHSRPAVINYNRVANNNDDVFIYYGSNDGLFRSVRGGFPETAAGTPDPGHEVWSFIPEEFFGSLQRMRNNEPLISSFNKKPYFADGSIGTYVLDANDDSQLNPAGSSGDKVQLFISMRRGGRFIYALDVVDPEDPKLLWRHSFSDLGWAELGYSWSLPRVTTLLLDHDDDDDTDPENVQVLIFGAGYDPTPEDVVPEGITLFDETKVFNGANNLRTMGRGVFVVEMETGDIIWQAGPPAADPTDDPSPATHVFEEVADMDYAIPSDVTVITDRNGSATVDNRAYVGDTGGQIWRIDMADPDPEDWAVTKLAALADHSDEPAGLRKFLFPPDVVYSEDGYDAVLIGAGDREHPFDESVVNAFYMIKDTGTGTTAIRGTGTTTGVDTTVVESDLFDATSNCIQDGDACDSGAGETPTTALADLASAGGWFIELGLGEKVVGSSVTLNSVTFFNTNQPSSASPESCNSDLGTARQYKVLFDDATAYADQNLDGTIDALDRGEIHAGGGYLPSPVPVVVEIDGQIHEGVISGTSVDEPPGSLLNARLRKFWYREME